MDEIDRANERAAQFLAHSLANAAKAPMLPPSTGLCFNCEEPVQVGERFCNCDCRNDWQLRQPKHFKH
jgi:hypothetical protein